MFNLGFHNPEFLYLLLLLIPLIIWYIKQNAKTESSLKFSSFKAFENVSRSKKLLFRHVPFVCRILALSMFILVIARPQAYNSSNDDTTEGIDIIISLDISGSMNAEDLKPNRLEAAKKVAAEFIAGRPNDNIGLVLFAGESFTQCPLTNDKATLLNLFKSVDHGLIQDGTAIGMGLGTAVIRLKDSEAESKVIILLTDGSNNAGDIDPLTAAEIAKTNGVRVYTIGIGSHGKAPFKVDTPYGPKYKYQDADIDESMLQTIANKTEGKYFRAIDNQALVKIYEEIEKLEKTKLDVRSYAKKSEEFMIFALLAALFILLELLVRNTILRKIP